MALVFAQTMADEGIPLREKLLLLWCTPKADELLAEWRLQTSWGQHLIFHGEACRQTWEGLGLNALRRSFTVLREVKVAARDIPNVTLRALYAEFVKIHKTPCEALPQCFDEQAQHRILRARLLQRLRRKRRRLWPMWAFPTRRRWPSRRRRIGRGPRQSEKTGVPMLVCPVR